MKKKISLILALCMFVLALAACAPAAQESAPAPAPAAQSGAAPAPAPAAQSGAAPAEPIVLTMYGQESADHQETKMCEEIVAEIEKRSNGGISIDFYPGGVLGDYTTAFDEVIMGTIDISVQAIPGGFDSRTEMTYIPYLFTSYDSFKNVFSPGSNCYEVYNSVFEEMGLKLLGVNALGYHQYALTKEEPNMSDPTAKKSVLLRVPGLETFRIPSEAIGFPTVTVGYSDLYTAMQTGVCDGWIGGTTENNYVDFRDIIKYVYVANPHMESHSCIVNTATFESLPAEYQQILVDVFSEYTVESASRCEAIDNEYIDKLREYGVEVVELTEEQIEAYAKVVREQAWPQLEELYTKEVMDAARADAGM